MQSEQKVCEQEVRTGLSKKSLQIWHRREFSSGANSESGVFNQSVESGISKDCAIRRTKVSCGRRHRLVRCDIDRSSVV
jgi:hypothetical protein